MAAQLTSKEAFELSSKLNPHYNYNDPKNQAEIDKMSRYDRDFQTVYGGEAAPDSPEYAEALTYLNEMEKIALKGKSGYDIGVNVESDWGLNKVVDFREEDGEQVCIKELTVWPNNMLSLQSHNGRQEVWQVHKGTLSLIMDDKVYEVSDSGVFDVTRGSRHQLTDPSIAGFDVDGKHWSIILPKGSIHCMINRSDEDVFVVETQRGITREADNKRFVDQVRNQPIEKYRATIPLPSELHYKAAQNYWAIEAEIAAKVQARDPNWKVSYAPALVA